MSPERRGITAILILLLLGSSLLVTFLLSPDQEELEARLLKAGDSVSGELRGGERHLYRFPIERGQAFRIILDPGRGDFVVALFDPFRSNQLLIDTRNGLRGPEVLYSISDAPGCHLLEVRSHAPAGRLESYALKLDRPHPVSTGDRLRQAAMVAFSRGEGLYALGQGALIGAADEYGKSLDLWQITGEPERMTATRYRLGQTLQDLYEQERALNVYRPALVEARSRGDRLAEAFLLDRMGRSFFFSQQPAKAAKLYEQSLVLFRLEKYRPGEADVLNNLGLAYTRQGKFPEGISLILESLRIWEELGGLRAQVLSRQNLGDLYIGLAEPDKAFDQYESALEISSGQTELLARVTGGIGAAHAESGRADLGIPELAQSVELWRGLGNRRWEAITLIRLADAHTQERELTEARNLLQEALRLARRKPIDHRVEGMALGNLGRVLDLQGQGRAALAHFDQARAAFEDDPSSLVRVLRGRAEAALHSGDLDVAHKDAQEAIAILERLRSPLPTEFSLRRSLYELHVEILMSLHERNPDESYAIEAFNAAEAVRSRSLLDDAKTLQVDLDPGLLAEKADLEERLRRLEMQRWASQETGTEAIERKIREVETSLGVFRTRLEERGLAGSPRALTLPEVQRSLDPDTLLLVYFLGAQRAWLWEVTSDRFVTHKLAERSEVEKQAEKVNKQLARNSPREWHAWTPALKKLSGTLLEPVAEHLEERHLLISSDGILHLTPFAALLDPRTLARSGPPGTEPGSPRFLILDHRLVMIPSISAVTATREALAGRTPALGGVAVMAAPDFAGRFEPLRHSFEEGQAIYRLAPPGRSFLATGRQASRAMVLAPKMGLYSYLHFATHGQLRDRPDLSWIALSFHDEQGRLEDGFLRAFEIYDLDLSAELVVLSACETALGAERGGLVRAFLQAGSRRVMATLWKVPDHSTPRLMESFYQGLLRQGMAPSAALQQAQIQMLSSRWKAPHYWAGFVLQGEWR